MPDKIARCKAGTGAIFSDSVWKCCTHRGWNNLPALLLVELNMLNVWWFYISGFVQKSLKRAWHRHVAKRLRKI